MYMCAAPRLLQARDGCEPPVRAARPWGRARCGLARHLPEPERTQPGAVRHGGHGQPHGGQPRRAAVRLQPLVPGRLAARDLVRARLGNRRRRRRRAAGAGQPARRGSDHADLAQPQRPVAELQQHPDLPGGARDGRAERLCRRRRLRAPGLGLHQQRSPHGPRLHGRGGVSVRSDRLGFRHRHHADHGDHHRRSGRQPGR